MTNISEKYPTTAARVITTNSDFPNGARVMISVTTTPLHHLLANFRLMRPSPSRTQTARNQSSLTLSPFLSSIHPSTPRFAIAIGDDSDGDHGDDDKDDNGSDYVKHIDNDDDDDDEDDDYSSDFAKHVDNDDDIDNDDKRSDFVKYVDNEDDDEERKSSLPSSSTMASGPSLYKTDDDNDDDGDGVNYENNDDDDDGDYYHDDDVGCHLGPGCTRSPSDRENVSGAEPINITIWANSRQNNAGEYAGEYASLCQRRLKRKPGE